MKKIKNIDPFEPLDEYERDLEKALNNGEFIEDSNFEERKKMFEQAARNYLKRQVAKPVTTRVNPYDLTKLKMKAKKAGMPYQTMLSALIHQFVEGKITPSF